MESNLEQAVDKSFIGHPKGVFTSSALALASAFAKYGMSSILIYYLYKSSADGGLAFEQASAAQFVAVYSSLSFMCGVIGSWVSDRILGMRKAIFLGQIFTVVGIGVLAVPGLGRVGYYMSFACLILGAISSGGSSVFNAIAGKCYSKTDTRRDAGFSLIYIFNNVGAVAPMITGSIAEAMGYNTGFLVAAATAAIGFVVYLLTEKKFYGNHGLQPDDPLPADKKKTIFTYVGIGAVVLGVVAFFLIQAGILTASLFCNTVSTLSIFVPAVYLYVIITSKKTTKEEAGRVKGFIWVFIAQAFNMMIWTQSTSILAIFAEERLSMELFGFTISAATWQTVPAILAILFGPIAMVVWAKLGNRQPSTAAKFGIGTALYGIATLFMIMPYVMYDASEIVSPIWLLIFYIVMIVGEVLTSPVGMSASTTVAPKAFSTQMVSVWLLSSSTGAGLSSLVVNFYTVGNEAMYFLLIGGVTAVLGFILLFFSKRITKTTGML